MDQRNSAMSQERCGEWELSHSLMIAFFEVRHQSGLMAEKLCSQMHGDRNMTCWQLTPASKNISASARRPSFPLPNNIPPAKPSREQCVTSPAAAWARQGRFFISILSDHQDCQDQTESTSSVRSRAQHFGRHPSIQSLRLFDHAVYRMDLGYLI